MDSEVRIHAQRPHNSVNQFGCIVSRRLYKNRTGERRVERIAFRHTLYPAATRRQS